MSTVDALKGFLEAMLAREVSLNSKKRSSDYKENSDCRDQINKGAREELAAIFDTFLTERAVADFGKAKMDTLGTGRPPEYEQEILADTLTPEGKGVSVETLRNKGLKQRFKYVFVECPEGLRLNELYIFRGEQEGWARRSSV
ncbi:NTF2 fold immunity protein [Pseudomonas entomophila]|uniref:NTF2 fold immunity protein n=1 Tax=Pseudomonas entomophila TaxID=312306 RepID=UPI00240715B3|nr:NTF2 fold immunity protein [Pseudomonas entomophila]MDF9619095.1 NTF2 fold immunity protein [Pseudomonas entomophila]